MSAHFASNGRSASNAPARVVPGSKQHQIVERGKVVSTWNEVEWRKEDENGNPIYSIDNDIAYQYKRQREYKGPLIWNYDDLLQYAEGDIEPVYGKDYAIIDTYRRRVRMPMREYLLCSRVTSMTCKTKVFKPCKMTTEYDLPINGELSEGGDVPWAVLVESGQADLMMCSYVGVDFQCKGDRVYRLLDTTLKFFGVAQEGQTLVYDIQINAYANRPGTSECAMFFFQYNCYVDGKLLIEMRGGVAGFFNEEELAAGKGVVHTTGELAKRAKLKKEDCTPFLINPARNKTSFTEEEMQFLSVHGRDKGWGSIFPEAEGVNYKLCARKMLMIDRVTHVMPAGGAHGLGMIIGEKILERDHWYFPCHFHEDQVMAGSLVADGCSQMLKLFMIWMGLHHTVDKLTFRPVPGVGNKVRCRGAIGPQKGKLVYVMEITDMGYEKDTGYPYAKALVNIININFEKGQTFDVADLDQYGLGDQQKRIVVDFQNIALRIEGKPTSTHPMHGGRKVVMPRAGSRSSIPRSMPTPSSSIVQRQQPPAKYMKWGGPKLGKPALMTWHPLAGKNGNPTPGFQPTAYPPRAVQLIPFPGNPNDNNHEPGVLPLSWVNLMEFTANRTSLCLGPAFVRFDGSNSSRMPAFDLQLVTRVLSVEGMEYGDFHGVDCNPGKGKMTAEFDCPADAWFFQGSTTSDHMPYSILMEIALQVSGVLTSWLKAPLTLDRDDLLFRNLDAKVTLVKDIDLRNKTIKNVTTAKSYSMLGSMGIHTFHVEMSVDNEVFYIVDTSFGWFLPEVFEKQTGMDSGKKRLPWHMVEGKGGNGGMETYSLRSEKDVARMFGSVDTSQHQVKRRSDQVNFVDTVHILKKGGKHGMGYASGNKQVNKQDWFFSCHFWCDPVMPGSLGIESMFECMEYWSITQGLTSGFQSASFGHGSGETKWKYRGQLTPRNDRMDNEVHIKSVTRNPDGSVDVVADAGLYVDNLRVYGATDLRLRIQESKEANAVSAPQSSIPRSMPTPSSSIVQRQQPPAKYMKWGGPKLGKPALMTWHPLAGKNGNPTPGFQPTAYPPRAVQLIPFPGNPNDNNHEPGVLPLSWVNLMEFTANRTSLCLGPAFVRFDGSNSSRMPAFDLQLVTRVLSVEGMEYGDFHGVDCNPGKGKMTAEFDCPADAWFFQGSTTSDHMPYSILMEIALQVSGVLTSWLKAPLTLDRDDLLFRNLDAKVTLVKDIDLRNKTIKNVTTAKSYSMLGSMGIHTFHVEMSVDNEVFYIVDTSFGWFLPEVFEKQTGMDSGKKRLPWHMVEGKGGNGGMETYSLRSEKDVARMFGSVDTSQHQVKRRSDQVNFVDTVHILKKGGKHGMGYASGNKQVNKQDWFFSCHFWCDPVMPGSLGIESMFECMEYWSITQGLTSGFQSASFGHGSGETKWKYRGQLTPRNDRMDNEVHIKSVTRNPDGSVDVVADAGLYVDNLRVYGATDLRLRIEESKVAKTTMTAVSPTESSTPAPKKGWSRGNRFQALLTPTTPSSPMVASSPVAPLQSMSEEEAIEAIRERLVQVDQSFHAHISPDGALCGVSDVASSNSVQVPACTYANLGDASFLKAYNCKLPLYTGAMAKGIASAELVVAAGKAGILASLGAGGLPLALVEKALDHIQSNLSNGEPYAVNLIHSPFDDGLEKGCVDLLLRRGVRAVEASAFMSLTPHVVRYRVSGLKRGPNGKVICMNKILFKVSRTELAEMALRPPPQAILNKLLKTGAITREQAEMSQEVPMCDDIAVEADSGGHTDNRPMHVILPLIMRLRDRITRELGYGRDRRVRVGAGGGIGCPEAALAAFSMGAAFVVTGTINQMCREAGTCDYVRKVLSEATYSDVTMAPAADMFDQGVELQVIKKGTLFASRAKTLFKLFQSYESLDEIPAADMKKVEKRIFQKSCDDVWQETRTFYINRLKDPEKVERAETKDPKLKMSMTFRWYLSKSSGWANRGDDKSRQLDYQIWCGPAIGSFNEFIKGTYLDPKVANAYPEVVQCNRQLLMGACYLRRFQALTRETTIVSDFRDLPIYTPENPL